MKVAIGQLTPVFLDRAATLSHVVRSIHEAADAGAALVAFGETLVPAYPAWLSAGGGARFVASELRGYVVSASNYLPASALPHDVRERMGGVETGYDGGSCIAGPDGTWIVEPVVGKEALIVAELDPSKVAEERQNFDPAGHYSRPDVLRLQVDRRRQRAAVIVEE